ncbi:calcium-binding protein [Humisphaera borealis]|uniref:Calcium-binding protein n=1 Tax=Humisphaera borealis TaxID=2807512 RepID=A0A7M2WTK9_9BACT|nr:calcium-binding protein [Humisphaera borealis]QOV88783.1 hypothetical protein IPV69_21530 [Humisphaera borealis]
MFETLENRKLFAVTASAFHDTLYVWGDNNQNGLSVEKQGTDLVVKKYVGGGHAGYEEFFRVAASDVSYIRMYGYDGADTMTVADNVTEEATLMGGKGGDYLKGGGGMSYLWGHGNFAGDPNHGPTSDDSAADILVSGKGYAVHYGQKGNDSFYTDNTAGSGYDVMNGGDGNDNFNISGSGNTAYAFGEAGNDTFTATQAATQNASFYGGAGYDTVDYSAWTSAVYVSPNGTDYSGLRYGTRRHVIQSDVEAVKGGSAGDYFNGSSGNNTFYGNAGNDTMYGNAGADILLGGAGNDSLYGGSGNDFVNGEAGNDTLYGDSGDDDLFGGTGQDDMHGGSGNDDLYGEADSDWLYGDSGNDTLVGGTGADYLVSHDGVFGNDIIFGDNKDGTGAGSGVWDVAYIDSGWPLPDFTFGVESISF